MDDIFINIPRTYTAFAEWLFCILFILHTQKNYKGTLLYTLLVFFLGIFIGYQLLAGELPIILWIPGMVGAVILMFTFIYSVTKTTVKTAIYFTVFAFILAEFTASLEWQIYYFFLVNYDLISVFFEYIVLIIVYGIVFSVMYLLEKRYKMKSSIYDLRNNELITIIIIGTLAFAIGNLNFIDVNTPFTGRFPLEVFYIRSLVLFSGVIMLYTQREHRLATHSRLELAAVESVLEKQYEQYKINQELNEMINRRYHDFKHQINLIRNEHDEDKKNEYLNSLENDIKGYELQFNTGNDVLDTVLASKSQVILKNKINFTCVAEGESLSFLPVMDLVSLFGNALDNAIESVAQISEEEKRVIKLTIITKNQFVITKLENYYETPIIKGNNAFLTTKKDKKRHGYGLKSIKALVEKHSGELSIDTTNNWFKLVIMFPVNQQIIKEK
ncbi:MAG: GHKL domain-containing protein [Candidatus Izemoplasma sp.]|nr:GHKL domain-containing protein [Candidatus Izemoplasma sp.]